MRHKFDPASLLTFIELDGFSSDWADLGLNDDDLLRLQVAIMAHPKAGNVIKATGGLCKLRFSSIHLKRGKRGGFRVCYVYFEEYSIVLLVAAFSKSESADLSPSEKKEFKKLIAEISMELESGPTN